MLKKYFYNDCTERCHSKLHGSRITSTITKRKYTDNQLASYIYCICANCGNVIDDNGRSALHVAAACGKKELVKWLIKIGKSDINLKDLESGFTPIHYSLFYGQIHIAVLLLKYGANPGSPDNEGMKPIDHLIKDKVIKNCSLKFNEVYIWGRNSNYNLGTGSQQSRTTPENLELLKRFSIKQVCMNKFHSVFVSDDGKVWSCGHGQGGRLGLKSENTAITPQKINFDKENISKASISQDHSMFLSTSGTVYVCGLNSYHQLGLSPAPNFVNTPAYLKIKSSQPLIGICCGNYHSVCYSKKEVFTFGTHAGQLGHSNLNDKLVIEPRMITDLSLKDNDFINEVVASDAATAVLVNKKDIYVYYQHECRKLSPFNTKESKYLDLCGKSQSIQQMSVSGGQFKAPLPSGLLPGEGEELKIAILSNFGHIFIWSESCPQFIRCIFPSLKCMVVEQFSLCANHLALVSQDGQAYISTELKLKQKLPCTVTQRKSKILREEGMSAQELFTSSTPNHIVIVERVANVTRAVRITSDPKAYNFAVLQFRPLDFLIETNEIPEVTSTQFQLQLMSLLKDSSELDAIHDVIFHVGYVQIPAHKYIIASRCKVLYDLCQEEDKQLSVVELKDVNASIFEQILLYIYTNDCPLLHPGQFKLPQTGNKPENVLKLATELATKFQISSFLEKLQLFKFEKQVMQFKDPSSIIKTNIPVFDRHAHQHLYNISIASCDGTIIKAHKCILAGRLEYFHNMLTGGWIETGLSTPVQLPIPGSILHEVINFLYTNTTSKPLTYSNVEYWANLLVVADQLFIDGLKECCEVGLTYSLTLKNAVEVLGFAVTCNALQLKESVMNYIVYNLSSLFESRYLEYLSDSLMKELVDFYKVKVNIGHREVTPCTDFEEFVENNILEISKNYPNPWKESTNPEIKQTNLKSKPGRRRRKSTMSEDESVNQNLDSSYSDTSVLNVSLGESVVQSPPAKHKDEVKIYSEQWIKIRKQHKNVNAQVRVMNAVKESPGLLEWEEQYTSLESSQPIAISQQKSCMLTPPPSLEDTSHFPTLLSTSPEANIRLRPVNENKKSSRKNQPKPNKKIAFNDLESELNKISSTSKPIPTPSLSSRSVWGNATSPSNSSSPWANVDTENQIPNLSEILKETRLSSSTENQSFSQIMADEVKKNENLIKMTSKCLDFIQMEDKAIEELKIFYNVENSLEENLIVSRVVDTNIATPMWISDKFQTSR